MASSKHRNGRGRRKKTTRKTTRRSARKLDWVDLSDQELLDLRFCDLDLRIEGTPLENHIDELYDELASRDLRIRPHCWLAEEFFSPDGIPGIAIPFYLAHPRLARLERKQIYEVEGSTRAWCLKILRHEAGHALDTSFRLSRRQSYRRVFGHRSQPYPEFYQPKPFSKRYVLHLDRWYAQSHPVEDFAETFAVWLRPGSRWRSQYREWPALKKLEYVDGLMHDLQGAPAQVRSRKCIEPLSKNRKTLREHYDRKRSHYGVDQPCFYDSELRRLFCENGEKRNGRPTAARYLSRIRPELRRVISNWTGEYQYTIDQILSEMIARCRELNLRLDRSERETKRDALVMLTVQIMNYLHGGYHRLAL